MTTGQCEAFLAGCEEAGITTYQFNTDLGTRLYNNGVSGVVKPDYTNECVVAFGRSNYSGAVKIYEANVRAIVADFADIHEIETAGSYEQIMTFASKFAIELSDEDKNLILQIDKKNYDIKPIQGDYAHRFVYLSKKQYEALTDEEKAAYDEAKAKYEKEKAEYIPQNSSAIITMK